MESLIWVIVLIVIAAVIMKALERSIGRDFPYERKPTLFSPAERSFLGVLDGVVGTQFRVFGKVRVADVVDVKRMSDRKRWGASFNRIKAKHFDFLVCRSDDLSVVCAVELDDSSHRTSKRGARDAFLEELCESIALPLIRIEAKRSYSIEDVRRKFEALLIRNEIPVTTAHNKAVERPRGAAT